jgi:hypothetical protein
MNAKSKKTLKAAAFTAGLVATSLPMGCHAQTTVPTPPAGQGSPGTVVAPPTVD